MNQASLVSTPVLVLTVGVSMRPAVAEVEQIFLQGDPRRAVTTRFVILRLDEKGDGAEIVALQNTTPDKPRENFSRRQVYKAAEAHLESLKAGLRLRLHELRSHEKLIEVGLGDKSTLPLDVILAADLSEQEAACLPLLLHMLHSLLEGEPEVKVHLLLSLAVFEEDSIARANVHVALNQLRDVLSRAGAFKKMEGPIPQVYLFDRYKEGVWEVRDPLELHTVLGNFLLAMLSGGLAQQLAHSVSQADIADHHAFFNGAAATLLFVDLEQLKQVCAIRLGAEILREEFHSSIHPDPGPVDEMAGYFIENHANPATWVHELCRDSHFHARAGQPGLDFHASNLRFENVIMEQWVETILRYDREYQDAIWPGQTELLEQNADRLKEAFIEKLLEFVQLLPNLPRLYPGGPASTRQILEKIERELISSHNTFGELTTICQKWDEAIAESLERLSAMLRQLPQPPAWVQRLPSLLRKPAIQIFQLIFLRQELQALTAMRQACVQTVEQKYAALFESSLAAAREQLAQEWARVLQAELRKISRLQSALDAVERNFSQQAVSLAAAPSPFRFQVLDESLLSWAYYSGKRPADGFRHALLTDQEFLKGWQKTNSRILGRQLMDFCREIYQPLEDLDLEQALQHSNEEGVSVKVVSLIQGTAPLLRPNFDQSGSGFSHQLRFFQARDPRASSLYDAVRADASEWQELRTNDPYLAAFCRVRMLIPLSALKAILERGRDAYEALSEDVRKEMDVP